MRKGHEEHDFQCCTEWETVLSKILRSMLKRLDTNQHPTYSTILDHTIVYCTRLYYIMAPRVARLWYFWAQDV